MFNPYDDPNHPVNAWPAWRRHAMLFTLATMAFTANYSAGSHLTIFEPMAEYYEVSITAIANSVGIAILGLGLGGLLWNPLAQAIGHRPVYLIAWTLFMPCTFWMAFAKTYSTFAAGRFFSGFTGGVCQVLPAVSITQLYRPEWRGTAISLWSLFLILGPPTAPLITSAVTISHEWQYCYYVVIIFSGVQWLAIFFFAQETLYIPPTSSDARHTDTGATRGVAADATTSPKGGEKAEMDQTTSTATGDIESTVPAAGIYGRCGAAYNPLREPKRFLGHVIEPLVMAMYVTELLPALWGAVAFGWSVGITILVPQMLGQAPYMFTHILVGCAFLAILVGAVLGKVLGGFGSDWTVSYFTKRKGDGKRLPEYRVVNMIPPTFFMLVGLIVFGYGFGNRMAWWVPIVFGAGIFYIGLVSVSSALQTYMSECSIDVKGSNKSMSAVQLYNLLKCAFSFGVPFYMATWADLPDWEKGGRGSLGTSYLAQALIITVSGLLMMAFLIAFGGRARARQGLVPASAV